MSNRDAGGDVVVCSSPSVDDVLSDVYRRALSTGTGVVFIGLDQGKDSWSTEVQGVRHSDGSIEVTSIRQWLHEIDVEVVRKEDSE